VTTGLRAVQTSGFSWMRKSGSALVRLLRFLQTSGVLDVCADFLFGGVGRLLVVWRAASAGIWVALAAWWVEPPWSS
jgi:hypothetical protein